LPQQEPGPAHPAVEGAPPQQDVSPGPGYAWRAAPVNELVADIFLIVSIEPQAGQASPSSGRVLRISFSCPQF